MWSIPKTWHSASPKTCHCRQHSQTSWFFFLPIPPPPHAHINPFTFCPNEQCKWERPTALLFTLFLGAMLHVVALVSFLTTLLKQPCSSIFLTFLSGVLFIIYCAYFSKIFSSVTLYHSVGVHQSGKLTSVFFISFPSFHLSFLIFSLWCRSSLFKKIYT